MLGQANARAQRHICLPADGGRLSGNGLACPVRTEQVRCFGLSHQMYRWSRNGGPQAIEGHRLRPQVRIPVISCSVSSLVQVIKMDGNIAEALSQASTYAPCPGRGLGLGSRNLRHGPTPRVHCVEGISAFSGPPRQSIRRAAAGAWGPGTSPGTAWACMPYGEPSHGQAVKLFWHRLSNET
jgi:hypothetical protein